MKFFIFASPVIFFYASQIARPDIKFQILASKVMIFRTTGSVFLSPARFQRATARALTPNTRLAIVSSDFRKWFNNPTVVLM